MQDNISFFELDNKGVVHYLHSQPHGLEMVYEDTEDDKLYRLDLRRDFSVVAAAEIECPAPPSEMVFRKWHKPSLDLQCDFIFTGCIGTDVGDYRFTINSSKLTLVQPVVLNENSNLQGLECIKGIRVDYHVQKGNIVYLVGCDEQSLKQVFAEVHIATDKAVRIYTLESDEGLVFVHTLSIDPWSGYIYLGGELREEGAEDGKQGDSRPYLETLCYKKPTTS